jgi:hypothetical protein
VDIDKEKLKTSFELNDMDYVFKQTEKIIKFLLVRKFNIYDSDIQNDYTQECMLNFYKKILENKVDPSKNIFSFIWKNSNWRILEILRKERKRNDKVVFQSLEDYEDLDFLDTVSDNSRKYMSVVIRELSTA